MTSYGKFNSLSIPHFRKKLTSWRKNKNSGIRSFDPARSGRWPLLPGALPANATSKPGRCGRCRLGGFFLQRYSLAFCSYHHYFNKWILICKSLFAHRSFRLYNVIESITSGGNLQMKKIKGIKSRKKTPWDGDIDLTATQTFLKEHYEEHYVARHRKVAESDEAELINSYPPTKCPFCGSAKFRKRGLSENGIQRYLCSCKKAFIPTTGTIFDERKISISEWMEYCLNLFRHVSITADSWNNKNAFTTSRYWLQKLFLTLETVQDDTILSEDVWLDETYYSVRTEDIVRKDNGNELRGISRNQICIGVATDKQHSIFYVEGTGKPTQKRTFELFEKHIQRGSTLYHDQDTAHKKLVKELELKSIAYASKDLKGLPDKENPLNPINRIHAILTKFLNSHSGFKREDLQGYLNLFALITNPPDDMLEKVEIVIKMAFRNPKSLRYRDFFGSNTDF